MNSYDLQIFRAKTICSFCPIQPLVVVCFVCLFLPWSKHSPKCFSILNCHPSSMTSQPSISIVISYRQRKPNNINGNRKKIFRFIVAFITLVLDICEKGWHSPICLFFCCCLFVCFFFPFKDICKNIKNDDVDNNNNNNNNNNGE